MSKRKT